MRAVGTEALRLVVPPARPAQVQRCVGGQRQRRRHLRRRVTAEANVVPAEAAPAGRAARAHKGGAVGVAEHARPLLHAEGRVDAVQVERAVAGGARDGRLLLLQGDLVLWVAAATAQSQVFDATAAARVEQFAEFGRVGIVAAVVFIV